MFKHRELLVVRELQGLREMESQLQARWNRLKRTGGKVRSPFLVSLCELESRARKLEIFLEDSFVSSESRAA